MIRLRQFQTAKFHRRVPHPSVCEGWDAPHDQGLKRRYGQAHLHFITCSCYHRQPFLRSVPARDLFLEILDQVRHRYGLTLVGYVVMPEHIHLLIDEPPGATPSVVMQVPKQRVSKVLPAPGRKELPAPQMHLSKKLPIGSPRSFWQPRFYDFNVWSRKKKNEKLHFMHFNPVKRGLVVDPKLWLWSSYRFYRHGEQNSCTPDRLPW